MLRISSFIRSVPLHVCVCPDLKAEIEATSTEYVQHIKSLPQDDRQEKLDKTKELFRKATEHSDNKVQIAMQMYEMVSTN